MPSSPSHPEFAPERALPSLPWLAALGLLVVNDHLLKGAGLLPGVVTGKLSDFAGMIVAPALLATLVRARTRTGLIACHAAIALVFAGIQVSPAFADLWSGLMGLVGYPWVITSDPTDLIALPLLVVAWRLLVPRMTPSHDAHEGVLLDLRRLAQGSAGMLGLWACVATSRIDGGIDTENSWYEDVFASLVVHNANDYDITLFVRPLRPELALDCDAIEADPGRLLPSSAFADAEVWTLPPNTNMPVLGESECNAAWIGGEGVPPTILFWRAEHYPVTWFAGQYFDTEALPREAAALLFDDLGARWIGGEAFRFTPDTSVPEQDPSCEFASDERVDWDTQIEQLVGASGVSAMLELAALEHGVDGCDALELVHPTQGTSTAYLCAGAPLPFAVGESIRIYRTNEGLRIVLMDGESGEIVAAADGGPALEVSLLRGATTLVDLTTALGNTEVVAIPRPSCEWQVDAACAVVERPFELAITGVPSLVGAGGEPLVLVDPEQPQRERQLSLVSARERALADSTCVEGNPQPGFDLDALVVSRYVP
jgi:hypothetical protein